MVFGLLPVLLVAVIVAAVVARERSDGAGGADGDGGHDTLRRVFVYSLALLGAVLTASGLSGVLRAALEPLGGQEQRWSIALLLTAGAVSVHYGLVLREDRAEAPEEAVGVRLSQVIVGVDGQVDLVPLSGR